jgi:hypothetical protein
MSAGAESTIHASHKKVAVRPRMVSGGVRPSSASSWGRERTLAEQSELPLGGAGLVIWFRSQEMNDMMFLPSEAGLR